MKAAMNDVKKLCIFPMNVGLAIVAPIPQYFQFFVKRKILQFFYSEEKCLSNKIVFDLLVPMDSLATISVLFKNCMMIFPYFSLIALQDSLMDRNLVTVGRCPKFG